MGTWPTLSEPISQNASTKARKSKGKIISTWHYPSLHQGVITAATITEENHKLKWTRIDGGDGSSDILKFSGTATKLFPSTRDPSVASPAFTNHRRAEQAAHFLRTHYPDVDVPFEIIKDELAADDKILQSEGNYDPALGNQLESIHLPDRSRHGRTLLAFPSGSTGTDLNISPFQYSGNELIFKPNVKASWSFDTPIRQIVCCSPGSPGVSSILAARNYGQTTLFNLKSARNQADPTKPFSLQVLDTLSASDFSGELPADMMFAGHATSPVLWLISKSGRLYQRKIQDSRKLMVDFSIFNSEECNSIFWTVQPANQEGGVIVASERTVKLFDSRDASSSSLSFTMNNMKDYITGLAPQHPSQVIPLVTTKELLWLDSRYMKKPVLGWKHQRDLDRTLQILPLAVDKASTVILYSKRSPYRSVYSVSELYPGLYGRSLGPCALPKISSYNRGSTCVRNALDGSIHLLELSKDGSIDSLNLLHQSKDDCEADREPSGLDAIWSDDVRNLDVQAASRPVDSSALAQRNFAEINFSSLYESLFKHTPGSDPNMEATLSSVSEVIELMPSYMKRLDSGSDHLRTVFDIALLSSEEPSLPSRADFFTGTYLNSVEGFWAFKKGSIPIPALMCNAPWYLDLSPILESMGQNASMKLLSNATSIESYLVADADGDARPSYALQRDSEARAQLSLDLALSSSVFSNRAFHDNPQHTVAPPENQETGDFLSLATQALSLDQSSLPEVTLGFFRPILKGFEGEDDALKLDIPDGVKLLLAEWNVGADPKSYEYIDPYDEEKSASQRPERRPAASQHSTQGSNLPLPASQRPPAVIPASSFAPPVLPSQPRTQPRVTFTQPIVRAQAQSQQEFMSSQPPPLPPMSSQIPMPSTQILPGPFGGRQFQNKKKTQKKRIGGF